MEIVVASKNLVADLATALDVQGREYLVLAVKASWRIPGEGQRPQPLPPEPLQPADVYAGEPGASAMLYGADLVRFKPRCDVLFNACAHSPDGEPVRELNVAWRVGPLQKGLRAVGARTWQKRFGMLGMSEPAPFVRLPLHFGMAFGGSRSWEKEAGGSKQVLAETLESNPSGIGWAGKHTKDQLNGAPAPSLEALDEPIRKPDGGYRPVAFSAVGRHWLPRRQYAGTYDERWQKEVFPFLPDDFDERFHQCAPDDQQMDYPRGGEQVVLRNMMAGRPDVRFALPRLDQLKMRILRSDYSTEEPAAVVDTLYFEPDEGRFSAVWRASVRIRRRLQEFSAIAIGNVDPAWWAAKSGGTESACAGCSPDAALAEAQA